nr:retrovirus-related Pol polyprotein from transposon TNT 1-94 [Tanacetum cinerariifolium]
MNSVQQKAFPGRSPNEAVQNKSLVTETFYWDEEEVSDEEEVTQVKVLMALADDELTVGNIHARNGEWVDLTIRMVNALLSMDEDAEWQNYLKYINIDLKFVEEQRLNLTSKYNTMVERLNPDSKLLKFNTRRIIIPKSQAVNESLKPTKASTGPKSSNDSKAEPITPLPPLNILQGASPISEVTSLTFRKTRLRNYPECGICRSYGYSTSRHNHVIQIRGVLAESSQSNESSIGVKCDTYGSTIHSTTDDNEFDHFKKVSPVSINHEKYLVIVDEYSRYTWVYFLRKKSQAPEIIMSFIEMVENQNYVKVKQIKTNNMTEFRIHELESFAFSSPYTPEHNGVAERKNRTLIEAARTMMNGLVLSKYFWTEAVRIACYTHNISIIFKRHDKTPYEIFRERILNINYFHMFGCLVFIHNHKDHLGKIDAKANDGYFLGHSFVSKAFRGFNTRRKQIKETYHVTFNESIEAIRFIHTLEEKIGIHDSSRYPLDEFVHEDDPSRQYQIDSDILNYVIPHDEPDIPHTEDTKDPPNLINTKGTHEYNVQNDQMITQPTDVPSGNNTKVLGSITESLVPDAQKHLGWVDVMQEELNQFYRKKYELLFLSLMEKQPLAPNGYLVARIEAIRIFLTFATYMNFKVYQMDVKSAFLNGKLKEEVYVKYPSGFKSSEFPNYVCKLDKSLYGLKQAPKVCPMCMISVQSKGITSYSCEKNPRVPKSAKKQQSVAMSLAEAEYVVAAGCCAIYQNFLMEFWSTIVSYDPFPFTDEIEQCQLREFLIKFLVLDGQRPLTLDFNTFCSSTGLDHNNDKYVAYPTPEAVKKELGKIAINSSYLDKTLVLKNSFPVAWKILFIFVIQVLGGNYSSTKQVNFIQQLLDYYLITSTKVDIGEINYSDLVTKLLNKFRLRYISYPRFISCSLQVLLGFDYSQDDSVSLLPLSAKPKKGKSQTMTPTLPKSQGPESFRALSKKGKRPKSKNPPTKTNVTPPKPIEGFEQSHSASLGTGTRKSQPLPESATINPKDSVRNKQPIDMGLTSTASDEGTPKTTSYPEGSLGDKDSGGNKQPVNMEPINPTVANPSGTGEMDTQPLVLSTYADVRAFLLSDDEAQESEDDILGAALDTDSSYDDILKKYDNTLPLTECQLVKHLRKVSTVLFDRITEDSWEKHQEAAVNYANLKAYQIDKLLEASMSSLKKSSTTISDLYKGLNIITKILKEINNAINDDPVIYMKINEATKSFTKISTYITEAYGLKQDEELAAWAKSFTNMAWNLGSKLSGLKQAQKHIQSSIVTPTLALTYIPINVKGNDTNIATKDPSSHTEGETDVNRQEKFKEPKRSTDANIKFIGSFKSQPSIT